MSIPPWLLALGILVVVVAIGAYIKGSFHGFAEGLRTQSQGAAPLEGAPLEGFRTTSSSYSPGSALPTEGFYDAAYSAGLKACETKFKTCVDPPSKGGDGKTVTECTTTYNTCVAALKGTNTSVSSSTPAPSTAGSAGTSAANPVSRDISGSSGYSVSIPSADYDALAKQARTGQTATLTPELQAFLKQVQSAVGSSDSVFPTQSELDLAQGAGIVPSGTAKDVSGSTYKPNPIVIYPHQTPPTSKSGASASVPTDAGTDAEKILANAPKLASLRSMVRDDVKKTVADEMKNIRNNYELVLVPEDEV